MSLHDTTMRHWVKGLSYGWSHVHIIELCTSWHCLPYEGDLQVEKAEELSPQRAFLDEDCTTGVAQSCRLHLPILTSRHSSHQSTLVNVGGQQRVCEQKLIVFETRPPSPPQESDRYTLSYSDVTNSSPANRVQMNSVSVYVRVKPAKSLVQPCPNLPSLENVIFSICLIWGHKQPTSRY